MSWKRFVSDYLTFSRKDRIAIVLFLSLAFFMYLLAFVFPKARPMAVQEDTVLRKLLDTAMQVAHNKMEDEPETGVDHVRYEVSKKPEYTAGALFYFDPNTLEADGWKRLGLQDRTIKTILNYRSKGGRFYKHEDLKKIWGLPQGFYEHVKAYIQLANAKKENAGSNFTERSSAQVFKTPYGRPERSVTIVNVNTADTSALIALPGIGSKLAQRILNFRDKLGGFYSVDQIGETYGLPDSTFQKLKPRLQAHGVLKKFNINTATKDELKTHPYIRWNLANAIVEYRVQHGGFETLDALKNIVLIDEDTYLKIAPYLTL